MFLSNPAMSKHPTFPPPLPPTPSNHQMDFLEHAAVTDVVVPAIVLEEVRARNQSVFQRLKALTASDFKRFYVFANENHK